MNRSLLLEHLAQAERHVRKGAELLARERSLVELRGGAKGVRPEVWRLLSTMELLQALHMAHRDVIRRELADLDSDDHASEDETRVIDLEAVRRLAVALVFDHFAALGLPEHRLDLSRVAGAVLLVSGMALIRS